MLRPQLGGRSYRLSGVAGALFSASVRPRAGGHGRQRSSQKSVAGAASNALMVLAKLRICP